jgi:hypothetical protein
MGARQKKSKKPSGTKAEQQLEERTFFTDECLGRSVGEALRAIGVKVELYTDHFSPGVPDVDWLPVVGEKGWVVITKDKAIRRKPWEREKVLASRVQMFTLPNGNMTGEQMGKVVVESRLRMARFLHKHTGPFIANVSQTEVTLLADSTSTT